MGKNKKTRHEKKIADLRRALATTQGTSAPSIEHRSTFSYSGISTPVTPVATIHVDNKILKNDVLKTTILTAAIVVGQFVLLFLLKRHAINIPGISY